MTNIPPSSVSPKSKILVLHSSPKMQLSTTRKLTQHFLKFWQGKFPESTVIERDLALNPVPPLMPDTWEAVITNKPIAELSSAGVEARKLSDKLVAELKEVDVIVFGVPMYNFTIPSTLKTYIDYIVRSGITFGYDAVKKQSTGLLGNKKVIILTATGSVYQNSDMDFQHPYLKSLLTYIGLAKDLTFISAEGMGRTDTAEKVLMEAQKSIEKYINALS